jgi:hypothetical protein
MNWHEDENLGNDDFDLDIRLTSSRQDKSVPRSDTPVTCDTCWNTCATCSCDSCNTCTNYCPLC